MGATQFATDDQKDWMSIRLAVGSGMFITYFLVYAINWYISFKDNKKSVFILSELNSKLYLFGIGCLLSLNYYQTGVFQAIMVYFLMLGYVFIAITALLPDSIDEKKRTICYVILYFFLFAWYLGIIIDYFVVMDQL